MSAPTLERKAIEPGAAAPTDEPKPPVPRWGIGVGVLAIWIALWAVFKGKDTLVVGGLDTTAFHDRLSDFGTKLTGNALTTGIGDAISAIIEFGQHLISTPVPPSPAPYIGWVGVVAIATWVGFAVANWRIALLVFASFLSFGLFGFWQDSMDLLVVTLVSVTMTVLIGFPLAVWMAISDRAARVITLIIDLLQTMPAFVYLIFVLILFGIGAPTAVICTVAYAIPPIVRIAGFGIRDVSPTTIEATDSLGQTTWQRLRSVQIPMARSTIILGLNQTILAALSMAIIASYVAGPGLGIPVVTATAQNDFGRGLVPGVLIVVMGIMLDRLTTAASQRSEKVARGGGENVRVRRLTILGLVVPVAVAVWYSRYSLNAAVFPETGWDKAIADTANSWLDAFLNVVQTPAEGFKNLVSYGLLNPLQDLLANSPWWLAYAGLFALSMVIGGARAFVPTAICLTGIRALDLWNDSMLVLTMTLVATVLAMVLAVIFGVWMARSRRADFLLRPILDAGQTIPAFVYLIPVLALFGSTRFSAIIAGLVYAAPAAIKLVADGVGGISQGAVEASRSSGATTWQEIIKVQLPMAKGSLVLATNQALLYVLAMVVIGGLVGAQALGVDVVLGIQHIDKWGKGLAAGISIVLMGIWIDRVARSAAARAGAGHEARERAFRIGGWRPAIFTRLTGAGRW